MRFQRVRFQHGSLTREKRKSSTDVWIFRWRETDATGTRVNRKIVVGTAEQYRTRTAALRAVDLLNLNINEGNRKDALTVGQLVGHYREKELGEGSDKAHSTRMTFKTNSTRWILPEWKNHLLHEVKAVAVEAWLGSLPLAPGTRAKIRNTMSALFNHAIRYEWLERNPITLVRQGAKRQRIPVILEVSEIKGLLSELHQPFLAMVAVDAATGLRRSELLALQWRDVDFEALEIRLCRSIVGQVIGEMKTEASRKPVPLEPDLAAILLDWKGRTAYSRPEDWVFASPEMDGTQPYWPDSLLRWHIRPAAIRAGIQKKIGWHSFRHSLATRMSANGESVTTMQEILRHANSRITLDTYCQGVTSTKRRAQGRVLEMILPQAVQTTETVENRAETA